MDTPLIAQLTEFPTTPSSLITSANTFFKWGSLLLALVYAVTRFSRTLHIISVLQFRWKSDDPHSSALLTADGEFFTSDDDDEDEDDDDEDATSSSSEDETNNPASVSYENLAGFYDDPVKKRKFKIRRKRSMNGVNMFSLCDLVSGGSVVKFWDGIGIASSGSSVSIMDVERDVRIGVLPGRMPAAAEVMTAGGGEGRAGVSAWDVRVRRRRPAVKAEWSLAAAGPPVAVEAGGVEKVYVREGGGGKGRVWDVRNMKSPVDGERWWDDN